MGIVCGAACGGVAATVEYVRAVPELPRYLPGGQGTAQLWGFLACLYGGVFAAAGLVVALALLALLRATVLGGLLQLDRAGAYRPDNDQDSTDDHGDSADDNPRALRPPLPAAGLAALIAALLLGASLYPPTLFAQGQFHHRTLIALLIGGAAAGLLVPLAGLGLLLARLLAPGRRARKVLPALRGPLFLYIVGWALGIELLAGAVCLFLLRLQQNLRMTPPLRALNLALWTPALALGCLGLGHLAGRSLARAVAKRPGLLRLFRPAPLQAVVVLATLATPVLGLLLGYWETLRILDLRPLSALLVGVLAALLILFSVHGQKRLPGRLPGRLLGALLVLPLLLWGGALWLGRSDRVRKAALSQAPLAGPLLGAVQRSFDLDRDGFPSGWVVGGTDCDDLNPDIHPGAFDWPDDGIDQNCNGHQATLPSETVTPWPSLSPRPAGLPERPNVVLITIDAVRADHMSIYGYSRQTTPVLDGLAREKDSFLFRNGFSHAPSTRYSVPAILTGRYPSTIDWGPPSQHWPPEVLPSNRLISEMLQKRGYHTIALLPYHYFEPTWGLARGFDDYDVHLMSLHSMGGDPAATSGTSSRELADLAVQRITAQAQHPEQPYFLWVHFYDPHYRYEVHPDIPPFGSGKEEEDLYDGEIRYTDLHIGRVLQALRDSGMWDKTIIAVTADHGEGFNEHGIPRDKRHGYHIYANQTKVPMILRVPGLEGREIDAPVGHVDLLPTLLNLVGGQATDEPQLAGSSLLDLMLGRKDGPKDGSTDGAQRKVFQEVMYEGPTERKAVVTRRWHYIRNVIPDGTSELYDLQADPAEEHDLQGLVSTALAERELSHTLAEWMDESAIPRDFRQKVAGNLSMAPLPKTAGEQAIGATLGDWLEVVGADLHTQQARRGGDAEVAVTLHGIAQVAPGWHLFAHLISERGSFANGDHDPLGGLLPVQRIRPGQYVRDVVKIALPASFPVGPAHIEVGLFRGGVRAQVSGTKPFADEAQRQVRVATLVVR